MAKKNVVHHARLKQIFEELIIDNPAAGLDLNHETASLVVSICIK